jgi:hypothetical protein
MDKIDAKLIQGVVLLNRQYLLMDHLIETKSCVLRDFECAIEEKRQALNHVLEVYNYVFALIDHLVRYQKIAFVLPRLNQKSAEYRALNDAMGDIKEIRNQLQHINNNVENEYTGPLLGAVCWISSQRQFIASFNEIGRTRSTPGIILNTQTLTYEQEFCYIYNDAYHDLGKAIEGVSTFNEFVNSRVYVEVNGKPYDPKDHFLALRIDIQIPSVDADP